MPPRFSIVIPVYNEAGNLGPLLASTVTVLRTLRGEFEIIVVNDGSTDRTAEEIAAARARWPECTELRQPGNTGQADALLAGLRSSSRWTVTARTTRKISRDCSPPLKRAPSISSVAGASTATIRHSAG